MGAWVIDNSRLIIDSVIIYGMMPMEKKSILDWITRGSFFLLIVLVPLFFSLELTTYTLPKVVLSQILVCILLSAWFLKMTLRGEVTL